MRYNVGTPASMRPRMSRGRGALARGRALHLLDREIRMHDDGAQVLGAQGAGAGAGLRLRLFGLPEARIAEAALSLSDQKAQALLYFLAATGQAASRDHL